MAVPFALPRFQAFDSSGTPLNGGKLYTYESGTSTFAETYRDESGTIANLNPVVLDAQGAAVVWLEPATTYRFELCTSAEVVLWTQDDITGISSSIDLTTISTFDYMTVEEIEDVESGVMAINMVPSLQRAFDEAAARKSRLIVSAGTYGLQPITAESGLCIDVPSNITIEFEPGALFKNRPHDTPSYQMLRVWDRENITMIRPKLDGNKAENSATTGEFGMGISIRGGNNINIEQPSTINCWGDGIYLANSPSNAAPPENINIAQHFASGCRRQGMTLTSGVSVHITDPIWQDTSGTAPSAGLDIEPNTNADELRDIRIVNPRTARNVVGIIVSIRRISGPIAKEIDVLITGHVDTNSTAGLIVSNADTSSGVYKLSGRVVAENSLFIGNGGTSFLQRTWDVLGPTVQVVRPTVIDCNRDGQTSPKYGSPFVVLRDTNSTSAYPIGNLIIEQPTVVINDGSIPALFSFSDELNGIEFVRNCYFLDPINLSSAANKQGSFRGSGQISNKFGIWAVTPTGSSTIGLTTTAPFVFPAIASNFVLNPGAWIKGSPDIFISSESTATHNVVSPAVGSFVGLPVATTLRTNTPGSYLRLRPQGADKFLVIERVGLWVEV